MIELIDIKKSFKDKDVLKGISTTFLPGKCNLVIGQSGAGKRVTINAGETTGLYLRSDRNNAYTNGTSVGAIAATNSNLTIYEGYGVSALFGVFYSPRIWNGTIFYSVNTDNRDKSSIQYSPVAQTVNPDLFQTNIPVCESNLWLSGMSVVGNGKVTHYVDYKNKDECFKYEVKVLPEDVDSRSEAQVFKHLRSSEFDVYKYRPS